MKNYIDAWSYRLGLVSAAIALAMRTPDASGVLLPGTLVQGMTIRYMNFYKGTLLFLLINIVAHAHSGSRWS